MSKRMNIQENISSLFASWACEKVQQITPLPVSGSFRRYFRIAGVTKTAIGVFHENEKENDAFVHFTKTFFDHGFPVPQLFIEDQRIHAYLIEDLGDVALFDLLPRKKVSHELPENVLMLYQKVLDWLVQFQLKGKDMIDFSYCYPATEFDRIAIQWDLNYFKYYFLKIHVKEFDEAKLEEDFEQLTTFLLSEKRDFFMYRDFQSRNIMIRENKPYFIDYQGGRKGPLQYDVASLLYQAKANIPHEQRKLLLSYYIDKLRPFVKIEERKFVEHYYGFVLIRILQTLGAYGFRGLIEKKSHFLESIPLASNNLKILLDKWPLPMDLPYLKQLMEKLYQTQDN